MQGGTKSDAAVFLLTEYCGGGDLRKRILRSKEEGRNIEESKILRWCRNVTEALTVRRRTEGLLAMRNVVVVIMIIVIAVIVIILLSLSLSI